MLQPSNPNSDPQQREITPPPAPPAPTAVTTAAVDELLGCLAALLIGVARRRRARDLAAQGRPEGGAA